MADARKIIKKIGGSKKGSTRRSSSTRRKSRVMSRWKYVTIAALITIGVILIAYPFIRQAFNRFVPCTGLNIYGACIPKGYSVYGIDISHHQGNINWGKLKSGTKEDPPISFVYTKATEGCSHQDTQFKKNWKAAKDYGFIRGAYHFFSAESSGEEQAKMFIKNVKLEPGDLPPMVDVEQDTKNNVAAYRENLSAFILTLEKHYGVKPIIYTYKDFHEKYIDNWFNEYPLWIARYNVPHPNIDDAWIIWQCSENGVLPGIKRKVDINVFNGSIIDLMDLTIK